MVSMTVLLLALASAGLHILWNGACKATDHRYCFNAWLLTGCAVLSIPMAVISIPRAPKLGWEACIYAAITAVVWIFSYESLARSYEGDLSSNYPVARGSAPLWAALMGLVVGERLSGLGWLGLVAVVLGVWLMGGAPTHLRDFRQPGFIPALVLGITVAVYSRTDRDGATLAGPFMYALLENAMSAFTLILRACKSDGFRELMTYGRRNWRVVTLASLGSYLSYTLILIALTMAPAPYVMAIRATAVVWAVFYGGLILREPAMRSRLVYSIILMAGIVLLKVYG